MGRACLAATLAICAGLALGAATAGAKQPLLPPGGVWQSIPYQAELVAERVDESKPAKPARTADKTARGTDKGRIVAKASAPTARPHREAHHRHPVAAAAVPERAPPATAAARRKELERRLDVLMPGTKLGANIDDPYNPVWRRARPGHPAGEDNSLSLPFDDKGQAGFLARGYHAQPDVQNPHGNTGATFGLRQRF